MTIQWIPAERAIDIPGAVDHMRAAFRKGCGLVDDLVREMGGWDALPEKFEISGIRWYTVEDEISQSAYAGRWWETVELCDAYLKRIETFCNGWRERAQKKGA